MANELLGNAASAELTNLEQMMSGGLPKNEPTTIMAPQTTTPRPPIQYQQPNLPSGVSGNFQSSGERIRAQKQQLFGSLATIVKSGNDYIQQKKMRGLESDVERLLSAQSGLTEAQTTGDKTAIARNTAIINDIMSDPKKAKMLAKAFNIDLLGGGKNKAENQALFNAWKSFNADQKAGKPTGLNPNAQALLSRMPLRQQINPELAIRAQMVKDKLIPEANKLVEEYGKNVRALQTAQTAADKQKSVEKIAQGLIDAKKYGIDKQMMDDIIKSQGMLQAANIHAHAMIQAHTIDANKAITVMDMHMKELETVAGMNIQGRKDIADKANYQKQLKTAVDSLDKQYKTLQDKAKANQDFIAKSKKILQDEPNFFQKYWPFGQGAKKEGLGNTEVWDLQRKIQMAGQENDTINAQMKDLDNRREAIYKTFNIQPPPDTSSNVGADGSIDTTKDSFWGSSSNMGGGDITIDLSEPAAQPEQ